MNGKAKQHLYGIKIWCQNWLMDKLQHPLLVYHGIKIVKWKKLLGIRPNSDIKLCALVGMIPSQASTH